jgi:branched-subunit amino acid aminotransferase/4-amino-4-deoxychorismate lyase
MPPSCRMVHTGMDERITINGLPARVQDMRALIQTNYGHFTAMRVENGGVRGLDLHLDRMEHATRELFDRSLDRERVRGYLRDAVAGDAQPQSLRVTVFSRALNRERLAVPVDVDVLIIAAPTAPSMGTPAPLRLKSFRYAREVAAIKHVGTFPLFHYRRLAQQAGFDDAVFVDGDDRISEGSIWNIGFADADGLVWPDAPQLAGVSMQLLQSGLVQQGTAVSTRPIRLQDIAGFRAAFFTNASIPVRVIASIDDVAFSVEDAFFATLKRCYEMNPWQPV